MVWRRTGDESYLHYIKDWIDSHIDHDGNVFNTDKDGKVTAIGFTNLDSIDPQTGLMFHAYDESGASTWADPTTKHSAEFWCRAIGWFGMTLIEVLEILPKNHPKRPQLIAQVRQLVKAYARFQNPKSGLWYQVVNKGHLPENWLETSSSSMYTYTISMAVKRGYTDKTYFSAAKTDFDQTHILTANYIYDVPAASRCWNNAFAKALLDNWQISGTMSYVTGRAKNIVGNSSAGLANGSVSYMAGTVAITAGQACPPESFQTSATVCTMITDFTGGQVNARPNMLCDPNKGATGVDSTGSAYAINTVCFAAPTMLGDIGNAPRNDVRLPSIFNNDLAFFKNVPIGEKREIQLQWEIYNIFNHTNYRDIDGTMTFGLVQLKPNANDPCSATNICTAAVQQTRSSFGTPTSARAPRIMQPSIRINF